MRKTMMSMGLGLALSLGAAGAVFAQSTQPAAPRDQSAQGHHERGQRGARGERGPGRFLLKGITLSDAQKAQVKQLRESQRTQMQASRDQFRKEMQDARALREKGDTAGAKAKMQALRSTMQQNREREMASLRGILTPDQQKTFDANVAQMKERAQARMQKRANGQQGDRDWRGHNPNGR
ncbi:MAG TPA: Spy/CpxP family protein refolding chaperone [Gemmatimonadaceae bacterium]|nr:Spy/CpxP family protein refolding chaperone [Gemmatimonadaceae bacterium]